MSSEAAAEAECVFWHCSVGFSAHSVTAH